MSELIKKACKTENCCNLAAPKRNICYKCKTAAYRGRYPIKYAFDMLKGSAKKRNYPFGLTFDYFTSFVLDTGYMEKKGRLFDNLTIDRMDNNKGYFNDNIKAITKSENSSKYHKHDKHKKI